VFTCFVQISVLEELQHPLCIYIEASLAAAPAFSSNKSSLS
jgi:hypothetical protein